MNVNKCYLCKYKINNKFSNFVFFGIKYNDKFDKIIDMFNKLRTKYTYDILFIDKVIKFCKSSKESEMYNNSIDAKYTKVFYSLMDDTINFSNYNLLNEIKTNLYLFEVCTF